MKRRKLIYSLTIATGMVATGGLSAMGWLDQTRSGISRREGQLLRAFRAQVAAYPYMTAALLQRMTEPAELLERQPDRLKFRNASGDTVELTLKQGKLRAKIG